MTIDLESAKFLLLLLSFVCSGGIAVWRVSWIVSQMVNKINEQMLSMKAEFNALLDLKEAEQGREIGRVYERFDEYKTKIESNFMSKEMCSALHSSTTVSFVEITKKIDSLEKKVDTLLMRGGQ